MMYDGQPEESVLASHVPGFADILPHVAVANRRRRDRHEQKRHERHDRHHQVETDDAAHADRAQEQTGDGGSDDLLPRISELHHRRCARHVRWRREQCHQGGICGPPQTRESCADGQDDIQQSRGRHVPVERGLERKHDEDGRSIGHDHRAPGAEAIHRPADDRRRDDAGKDRADLEQRKERGRVRPFVHPHAQRERRQTTAGDCERLRCPERGEPPPARRGVGVHHAADSRKPSRRSRYRDPSLRVGSIPSSASRHAS